MKKTGTLLISVFIPLLIVSDISAQSVVWTKNHGGQYNESGQAGLRTRDGNFLIVGSTYSTGAGQYDVYVIKMNSSGDTLWTRSYGGELADYGYDIVDAYNDEYIITGSTRSSGSGKRDLFLLKIDDSGNLIWSKTYGGAEDDEGRSICATSDSNFVICGSTSSFGAGYNDLYLVKINSAGDTLWSRTYGGAGGESGYGLCESADSTIVAVGATGSFGSGYSSVYVVKTDRDGDSLWADAYGGSGSDFGYKVKTTPDNGYIFAGATSSYGAGYSDAYVFKTNSSGAVAWEHTYGGGFEDRGNNILLAADGTYYLIGSTMSYGAGSTDIYLVKLAPTGDTIWTKTYGGSEADNGYMIFQDNISEYIIIGESKSYSNGGSDMYVMKIAGATTSVDDYPDGLLPSGFALMQNYPNPFNMSTLIEYRLPRRSTVSITIYNVLGQTIREYCPDSKPAGVHSLEWDGLYESGQKVASGFYFYRFRAEDYVESKKMLLLK